MSLPQALAALGYYRQFITYRVQPSKKSGKVDKIPTDWRSGRDHDAHDPAIWTDYDTAYACSGGMVGFVFTADDPFFFLDIDNCLTPAGWSSLAIELCHLFPQAAREVSYSGQGLHIFGTYSGNLPRFKNRGPDGAGLEFYTEKRFAALGRDAQGDAAANCNAGLYDLIERFFNRKEESPTPSSWTVAPVPEWRGSENDDELIRRACSSQSAGGVFGNKANFVDLWTGNTAALQRAYPDPPGTGRPYDCSSADAALAQHLAFWTGKDCSRMQALMMRSKLYRDKYDRADYLPRTILNAVALCRDVCIDKEKEPASIAMDTQGPQDVRGETYLNPESQKKVFEGCVYVADINKIIVRGGFSYKKEQFDSIYGGFTYVLDQTGQRVTKSPWEAFTGSQAIRFDKVHSASFRPDKAPGEIWRQGAERVVNSYWPVEVASKHGNPQPFLDHLYKLLPNETDRNIILSYMAAVVQYRGVKFQWCPLLQGTRGNGKTLLSRVLIEAIGRKHCHSPRAHEITEKYNDWIEGKIFIAVEDIYVPHERQEVLEILKPMITSDWQEIRAMNQNKVSRFICANFILNSNHRDALRQTADNRGLAVFFTAQQYVEDLARDGMDGDYFPKLYNWLRSGGYAIVTNYLQNYTIPDELNPATHCHRAPSTSSTTEAIRESLGSIEQEIQAAILEGRPGFRNGWISTHFLDLLIKDLGTGYRLARNKRTNILRDMGYTPHPGIDLGQVHNAVQPDNCKPRLFITAKHSSRSLKGAAVAKSYSYDQMATAAADAFKVIESNNSGQ